MLLALDTSTNTASIALVRDERLAAELTWDVGQRHSAELLQRLDWLLETVGAKPADLTEIAVATGPGSFNGVRVASDRRQVALLRARRTARRHLHTRRRGVGVCQRKRSRLGAARRWAWRGLRRRVSDASD